MTEVEDDLDAIKARREEWIAAVNDGSLDRYEDLVTEDLIWLPPFGDPIEGRDGFRAWLEPFFEQYSYEFSLTPANVRLFDGWCAETGRFRSVLGAKSGGEPQEHEGSYLVLWRIDEDGKWRIERYVDGIGIDDQQHREADTDA